MYHVSGTIFWLICTVYNDLISKILNETTLHWCMICTVYNDTLPVCNDTLPVCNDTLPVCNDTLGERYIFYQEKLVIVITIAITM